jgi:hypothetical protein
MKTQHTQLADGRWNKLSFIDQMSNIGSEVFRTISWQKKDRQFSRVAFFRALELLDLTVADNKNSSRLGELLRLRELLVDYFMYKNIYGSSEEFFKNYFFSFNYASRINV